MSVFAGKKKCDLKELAIEFGASIEESDNIAKIIKKLEEAQDYDETLALAQLKILEKDRVERENEERLERERNKAFEREEKAKALEREHELPRMRLEREPDEFS